MSSDAEKIILPNGNVATLVATHTLTPINDPQIKVAAVPAPAAKVIVFLVGGAGDKKRFLLDGPNNNIQPALQDLKDYVHFNAGKWENNFDVKYLGYYEIYRTENIEKNVISAISSKKTSIYIVGHSLGGWNGAHLSSILSTQGYNVKMLITLDPVGESGTLETWSKIYNTKPIPVAQRWINIRAKPSSSNVSDLVAWAGEKWTITSGPEINAVVDINHADAILMLKEKIDPSGTAYQILERSIREDLSR